MEFYCIDFDIIFARTICELGLDPKMQELIDIRKTYHSEKTKSAIKTLCDEIMKNHGKIVTERAYEIVQNHRKIIEKYAEVLFFDVDSICFKTDNYQIINANFFLDQVPLPHKAYATKKIFRFFVKRGPCRNMLLF